jgi:hypothetical protein
MALLGSGCQVFAELSQYSALALALAFALLLLARLLVITLRSR